MIIMWFQWVCLYLPFLHLFVIEICPCMCISRKQSYLLMQCFHVLMMLMLTMMLPPFSIFKLIVFLYLNVEFMLCCFVFRDASRAFVSGNFTGKFLVFFADIIFYSMNIIDVYSWYCFTNICWEVLHKCNMHNLNLLYANAFSTNIATKSVAFRFCFCCKLYPTPAYMSFKQSCGYVERYLRYHCEFILVALWGVWIIL